jgi:hypothetical protein
MKIKGGIREYAEKKWHHFDELKIGMDGESNTKKREMKSTHNFNLKPAGKKPTGRLNWRIVIISKLM